MGAHLTLRQLAEMEKKSVEKKKAYLSLSKLSAAFSGSQKSLVEAQIEGMMRRMLLFSAHIQKLFNFQFFSLRG